MFIGCSSYLFSSSDFTKSAADLVIWNDRFPWPMQWGNEL